jgi:membrane protein
VLGDRVRWRALLPGAVVAGTGQVLVLTASGLYLQPAIESQAQRYGLIGVAFVLVTWMIALGLLLVLGAVLGAVLGGRAGAAPSGRCRPQSP